MHVWELIVVKAQIVVVWKIADHRSYVHFLHPKRFLIFYGSEKAFFLLSCTTMPSVA